MSTTAETTGIGFLALRATECARYRDELTAKLENPFATRFDNISYQQGKVEAFNDAHVIMKRELERLKNLFQNGALTLSDFDQA